MTLRRVAVVIGGPTASGKSSLALAVAREFGGTVINADSMQVYRELPVLTAQPSAADRAAVPHRLYGFLSVSERCNAARWATLARAEIDVALGEGRVPIVVGGTGLYLKALLEGLAPMPGVPADVREAAKRRLAELGKAGFHAELARRDPGMAARIRPSDSQRMVRAWEVIEATGRSLGDWQAQPADAAPQTAVQFVKLVLEPDRPSLYAACDARFAAMVGQGALAEVRAIAEAPAADLPAFKALGLRELLTYLRGEMSLESAIAAGQQATRRYAKRQLTWFRHQLAEARRTACVAPYGQFSERFLEEIFHFIRNSS